MKPTKEAFRFEMQNLRNKILDAEKQLELLQEMVERIED